MATYPLRSPIHRSPGRSIRVLALAGSLLGAMLLVGTSVFADLNATASNTSSHGVASGTLKLTMTKDGAGFDSAISGMVPGDVVHRFVTLTNGGTLAGNTLSLQVSDATPTLLSTDATKGLKVTVDSCDGGTWNTSTGTCSGTIVHEITSTALSSMTSSAATFAGTTSMSSSAVLHLMITVSLPTQTETTVNGTLPANTIQGLAAALTWTFKEIQRTATETNG